MKCAVPGYCADSRRLGLPDYFFKEIQTYSVSVPVSMEALHTVINGHVVEYLVLLALFSICR